MPLPPQQRPQLRVTPARPVERPAERKREPLPPGGAAPHKAPPAVPASELTAELQRGLVQLHGRHPPIEEFANESIRLIAAAVKARCGFFLQYAHPGRLTLLGTYEADPRVVELLLGRSGKWIPLRCINEKRINVIDPAHQNPFVPQPLISVLEAKYLGIATLPLMKAGEPVGAIVLLSLVGGIFGEETVSAINAALPMLMTMWQELSPSEGGAAAAPSAAPTFAQTSPLDAPPPTPRVSGYGTARPAGAGPRLTLESLNEPLRPAGEMRSAPTAASTEAPQTGGFRDFPPPPQRPTIAPIASVIPAMADAPPAPITLVPSPRVAPAGPAASGELQVLRQELQRAYGGAASAREEITRLRGALSDADRAMKAAVSGTEALARERDGLQIRLDEILQTSQQQHAGMAELESQVQQLKAQLGQADQLRNALEAASTAHVALETELMQLRDSLAVAESDRVAARTELRQRGEMLAKLQSQVEELTARLATAQQAAAPGQQEVAAERDELRRQLGEAQASMHALEARAQARGAQAQDLAQRAALVDELREALASRESDSARLEAELAEARREGERLQKEAADVQAALQKRTQDLAVAKFDAISLASRLADADAKSQASDSAQQQVGQLRAELDAARAEARAAQREAEEVRGRLAKKEREEEGTIRAWTSQMGTVEAERRRLEQELEKLAQSSAQTIAQLHEKLAADERERASMSEQVADLTRRNAELEQAAKPAEAEATPQQSADRSALLARVEELESQLSALTQNAETNTLSEDDDPTAVFGDADLARELLMAFSEEAEEGMQACEELILQIEQHPSDVELTRALFRQFHTLKGAAAAVGLKKAAAQLHEGETLLESIQKGELVADDNVIDFVLRLTDSVAGLIGKGAGKTGAGPDEKPHHIIADVVREVAQLRASQAQAQKPEAAADAAPHDGAGKGAALAEHDANSIRVEAAKLDDLLAKIGELDVARGQIHTDIQALTDLRDQLHHWRTRMAQAQRDAASAAEPGASLHEITANTGLIAHHLERLIDQMGTNGKQLSTISGALQQQVNELRFVPLDMVFRRLVRPVRDAAREAGKLVELEIGGGDVPLNRETSNALLGPLLHLVRNSIAHGIELPDVREQRGKPRNGTIWVTAYVRNEQAILTVADDGGGLAFDAILEKARKRGLIDPSATPTREELTQVILQPGFSTKEAVSDLAGRGVGMDVVAREVVALGGSLELESEDGHGMTVRLTFPVHLRPALPPPAAAPENAELTIR